MLMKKRYSRFRELWAVPKYQTLFKLGGYIIFFIVFFAIASLSQNSSEPVNKNNSLSYSTMKKKLLENNLTIKYTIESTSDYYLEGTLIDSVISSTLETTEEIKKIKIIEENIYLIQKNQETLDNTLLKDINLIYLFPQNIINILNNNNSLMKRSADQKIFSYLIDNKSYSVFTNETSIEKIIIIDGIITYTLEYNIIK